MNKKAQAAMEFLLTYGWAILVVISVIGSISYFGFFSPNTFLPDKCEFGSGFRCEDYQITTTGDITDSAKFKIRNIAGDRITITSFKLSNEEGWECNADIPQSFGTIENPGQAGNNLIENGDSATLTIADFSLVGGTNNCPNNDKAPILGEKENLDVLFTYYRGDAVSLIHEVSGTLVATIN